MSLNKAIESIYARADLKIIKRNQICAHSWNAASAYQAILPLRVENAEGEVVFVDAVPADHRATDVLAR